MGYWVRSKSAVIRFSSNKTVLQSVFNFIHSAGHDGKVHRTQETLTKYSIKAFWKFSIRPHICSRVQEKEGGTERRRSKHTELNPLPYRDASET